MGEIMKNELEKLQEAEKMLKEKLGGFAPIVGITLGSGLGYMADLLTEASFCLYSEILHCPMSGATGHAGRLWWGKLANVPVIMMQGRVHIYEGYTVHEVVFLTRLMIMLGCRKLILTHAVGAVTKNLEPDDIVGIRSHIALNCPDPTAGQDAPKFGTEFTPMGDAYSPRFLALAKKCAREQGVSFHWGVSHFQHGRMYETQAEIEYMRRAGADVATMSTIPEVAAGFQMGAEILDLALVTNMGAGLGSAIPLSHGEVTAMAEKMKKPFGRLIGVIISKIATGEKG